MNITKTVKPGQPDKHNLNMARQRGFFSIGVGLGLSALFALFGTALEPGQTVDEVSNQAVVQQDTTYAQNVFLPKDAYPGRHQF